MSWPSLQPSDQISLCALIIPRHAQTTLSGMATRFVWQMAVPCPGAYGFGVLIVRRKKIHSISFRPKIEGTDHFLRNPSAYTYTTF